ncbi:MAG: prepilin peptidase, partial [Firmicutes bacterium]|nr:prepilin peptidase [Bacillota bacterium]
IIDLPFFGEPVGVTWYEHLIGMFVISLPMLLLMFFGAMGGGDMKLYAAAGFLIGWKNAVLSIILACIFGSIASIILMLAKKVKFGAKEHIPFVPFIALSMPVVIFWGTQMINWYINRYFVFD